MLAARAVDRVLRGDADPLAPLDPRDPAAVMLGAVARATAVLLAVSGACVGAYGAYGAYGAFRPDGPEWRLVVAAAAKVPLLVGLTVAVTFPSLYVFNTLLGSRLGAAALARLVACACAVLSAVTAGFGPVVAFFSVSTSSYPFIVLLNVAVFAVAGLFAVATIRRAVARATPPDGPGQAGRWVVAVWLVVFALVGSQMGWVLRPFVGAPGVEFTWFRPRGGSFFEAVIQSVAALVGP